MLLDSASSQRLKRQGRRRRVGNDADITEVAGGSNPHYQTHWP